MAIRPSVAGCYWGRRVVPQGPHCRLPDGGTCSCGATASTSSSARSSYLRDVTDLTEEQRRLNRTATAAPAWSPHYGGFIMGGQVV